MATPITVRGIGTAQYMTDEYAIVPFMFEGTQRGQPILARFWREVHLVDNLKANLLIGIDVMGPELVTIDMGQKKVILESCNVEIPVEISITICSGGATSSTCSKNNYYSSTFSFTNLHASPTPSTKRSRLLI